MPESDLAVFILAGGSGERFWPLSRKVRPKQFFALGGEDSLIRQAYRRALALNPKGSPWVLSSESLASAFLKELPRLRHERVIQETVAKNTGPAIALGCHLLAMEHPGACVVILPSDHWIPELDLFLTTVKTAIRVARSTGGLVTLGIKPHRAETGYGYIERGTPKGDIPTAYSANGFYEKPELADAKKYLKSGMYFWNSGIFIWTVTAFLTELKRVQPDIYDALPAQEELETESNRRAAINKYFVAAPSISVDQGIMEKAKSVWVVEAPFAWSDLGTWEAWGETRPADTTQNRTDGDVIVQDASGNIVYSDEEGRVALLGVDNLVVVRTKDVTLVCPRERVQEIRELVRRMREENHEDRFL
ncbi:MAG: mannose-1-phosphate guanyltransferase [Candidatus Eisenbacteria bacterium]|nr:mannose-1-phosphate guanyltransferase [Candidatus Eisenbacteria bacterium]